MKPPLCIALEEFNSYSIILLLAAPPLDTRPCISRFALGPGFVYRKVTT